jgi:hypothetical protein
MLLLTTVSYHGLRVILECQTDSLAVATTIGPQMCGYKPNSQFEFMRDRSLRLAMKDAAGFHICLSMAATHLDSMNSLKPGSRALWHRIESIRLVNRYLSDPILGTSDRVIFAVAMLMAQEVCLSAPRTLSHC